MGDKYQCTVTSTGEMCLEIADFSWSDIGEYKVYLENQYGSATQIVNMDMAGQYCLCCFFFILYRNAQKVAEMNVNIKISLHVALKSPFLLPFKKVLNNFV